MCVCVCVKKMLNTTNFTIKSLQTDVIFQEKK